MQKGTTLLLTILMLLPFCFLSGQNIVSFSRVELDKAIETAQNLDKPIFIDTYAPWCVPCKKMDKVFREREVARFFNSHFVNVKFNMDLTKSLTVKNKYKVAFLPTLLILDKNGNLRFKIDRLIDANELLHIGNVAVYGSDYKNKNLATETSAPTTNDEVVVAESRKTQARNEISQSAVGETIDGEKILHVFDPNADDAPPEILYEEAYFRMQLMDGSHQITAQKYLDTQTDWSLDKNIRFIYDFLHTTQSKEFEYLLANRDQFNRVIGKDQVDRSIEMIVNIQLYQGIPRPTFEEARTLFELIDPHTAEHNLHFYFTNRLYEEEKYEEFRDQAQRYFATFNDEDRDLNMKYVKNMLDEKPTKEQLKECERLLSNISFVESDFEYQLTMAKVLYQKGTKEEALDAANKAVVIAKRSNKGYSEAMQLLEMIEEL